MRKAQPKTAAQGYVGAGGLTTPQPSGQEGKDVATLSVMVSDPSNEIPPITENTVYLPWGEEKVTYLGPVALVRSKSHPTGFHVVNYPTISPTGERMPATCSCRYYQIHGDCKRHIEAAIAGRAIARSLFEEAFPNGLI